MELAMWITSPDCYLAGCLNNNFPSAKENKPVWCLIMSYLLFFTELQLWILICSMKISSETSPRHELPLACVSSCRHRASCSLVGLQLAVLSGFVCSSHISGEKSMQIFSSEILAFSLSLKGCGVPQGWCLILAPFVSSIQV